MKAHLKSQANRFNINHSNVSVDTCMQDPVTIRVANNNLKHYLIQLEASSCLKMLCFVVASSSEFWVSNYKSFPNLSSKAF